jgi:hypothetical protein
MAKAENALKTSEPKTPTVGGKMVTYIPREDGDRPFVMWNGHRFEANVPKKISDQEMLTSAITNPWFKIEGHPQAKRVKATGAVPAPGSGLEMDNEATDAELDKMIEADE